MKRPHLFLACMATLACWCSPASAYESCAGYITGQPQEPYSPPGAEDDTDRIYAWYETRNDDPVVIIDGRRLEGPQQLIDRLYETDSPLFVIANADMEGWDLSDWESPVQGLCFYRSNLRGTRWDGRDLSRSAFIESDLAGASFAGAVMQGVLIGDSNLANVRMNAADLTGGRLVGGWFADLTGVSGDDYVTSGLNGWNLAGADLTGFVFQCGIELHNGCPLERGIDFTGADLSGADFATFPGWGQFAVADTVFNRTRVAFSQLPYLSAAEFVGPLILAGRTETQEVDPDQARMMIAALDATEAARRGPSFNCSLADQPVERMLCSEEGEQEGLWLLDRRMATAYADARVKDPRVADVQKAWLRLRAQCRSFECLTRVYEQRLTNLLGKAGVPAWLKRGTSAVFVEAALATAEPFRDDPLAKQLVDVTIDSANQIIVVTHQSDGTLSVQGRAIGANGHTCYLSAGDLRMDPESGWISDYNHPDRPVPVIRIVGDELFVLEQGRPDREIYPLADFVTCGARARFEVAGFLTSDPAIAAAIISDREF